MVNDQKKQKEGKIPLDTDPDSKNFMFDHIETPALEDEQSISGSASDPEEIYENDKDTLDLAHDMGLYDDADEENPAELNSAEEINKDEEALRYK